MDEKEIRKQFEKFAKNAQNEEERKEFWDMFINSLLEEGLIDKYIKY